MKIRGWKPVLCLLLLAALGLNLCACGAANAADTVNLMQSVSTDVSAVEKKPLDAVFSEAAANFAISLLQNSYMAGENTVLSPLSVLTALAMTANGAEGETLEQMEAVCGLPVGALNEYLYSAACETGEELVLANSIWMRSQDLSVLPEFLQTNADYYSADAFAAPFDENTIDGINAWVSEKTKGRIENLIDKMNPNAAMYLLNALTFDAEWEDVYNETSLYEGEFQGTDGVQQVEMMRSEEWCYLDDGKATGFLKDYRGDNYRFVALLPNEGISIEEYIASLSGEGLLKSVANAENVQVIATMPRFTVEASVTLKDALQAMGMTDAFDAANADFSRISEKNELYISAVLHKTWLSVDERGTEAGAATAVEIAERGIAITHSKTVTLDRPFVCGILDNRSNSFVFLGIINNVG